MTRRHVKAEPYCILCRASLLKPDECNYYGLEYSHEPWANDVFFFFDAADPKEQQQPRYQIFRFDLREYKLEPCSESLNQVLGQSDLQLEFFDQNCRNCNLENIASFVHIQCLQLAQKRLPRVSIALLAKIALLMRPILPWRRMLYTIGPEHCLSTLPGSPELDHSTDLGLLMSEINGYLPAELQGIICHYLSGLFCSLASCLSTLDCALGCLGLQEPVHPSLLEFPLSDYQFVEKIGADMVGILGESCLTRIGSDRSIKYGHEIPLSSPMVRGIQVSLGRYGVVAVRVLYPNGSSPWVGGSQRRWFTTYLGHDLRRLRTLSDGVKVLQLELDEPDDTGPETTGPARMLWDRETIPSDEVLYSLIDVGEVGVPVLGNPKLRLAQYLSLEPFGAKIRSLTVFCSSLGVCCIQVDENRTGRLGIPWETSCPITIYLDEGEHLQSLNMVIQGDKEPFMFQGPYVQVSTSKGRILFYGPHTLPYLPFIHLSPFAGDATRHVVGAFIDPTTSTPMRFNTIGVALASDQPGTERSLRPMTFPRLISVEPGTFLSENPKALMNKTHLLHVEALTIQRVHSRCTGLLIRRRDGTNDTLGQWDPSMSGAMSTIYEACDGPLQFLQFTFSDGPNELKKYVENISVATPNLSKTHTFTWVEFDKELAWWFTPWLDYIEIWEGVTVEFNKPDSNLLAEQVG